MSWVDACKAAFKVKADALIFGSIKNRRPPDRVRAIKQLSNESGIPLAVLKRWYYEKEQERITGKPFNMPLCKECNKRPVCISSTCAKPIRPTEAVNSYWGLCSTCAKRNNRQRKQKGEEDGKKSIG